MDAAPTRRLAAVMAADIVGYSRLMHSDEDRTLADLAAFRQKTFAPQVATHRGRVVKSMGDGWLVKFPAAADALACATALQAALAGQDRLQLRIGLHVGDVVLAGDDLFGDGVNIAAGIPD